MTLHVSVAILLWCVLVYYCTSAMVHSFVFVLSASLSIDVSCFGCCGSVVVIGLVVVVVVAVS